MLNEHDIDHPDLKYNTNTAIGDNGSCRVGGRDGNGSKVCLKSFFFSFLACVIFYLTHVGATALGMIEFP